VQAMDKIIGFTLTRGDAALPPPPYVALYPWIEMHHVHAEGWALTLWGHGDLESFVLDDMTIVGYSNTDLATLTAVPLQNRGVCIRLRDGTAVVYNDHLGMMPVFYGASGGVTCVSTCEESVMRALGNVALDEQGLVSFLTFSCDISTVTLWKEIRKLYANTLLEVRPNGTFSVALQPPLEYEAIDERAVVWLMHEQLERTVRLYTDSLGEVFLPLTSGYDSRLILCHMQRPERIHARTYGYTFPPERSYEVVVARKSAELCGAADHRIVDIMDYSKWVQPSIEHYGTCLGAGQAYIFGAVAQIVAEARHPVILGQPGDTLAGKSVKETQERMSDVDDPAEQFKVLCHCQAMGWDEEVLDDCLTFDWRASLSQARSLWSSTWTGMGENEFPPANRMSLARIRDRTAQYTAYPWTVIVDLWSSVVTPYADRDYVSFMLSLPVHLRHNRAAQSELMAQYFPKVFDRRGCWNSRPWAGLRWDYFDSISDDARVRARNAYDVGNIVDENSISGMALWPLEPDGSKPAHPFFAARGMAALYERAVGERDVGSFFHLNSLQPIAWAIDKGYVGTLT